MNDEERRLWVLNDEPLYRWWKEEKGDIHKFLKKHRKEIDATIHARLHGEPYGPPKYN